MRVDVVSVQTDFIIRTDGVTDNTAAINAAAIAAYNAGGGVVKLMEGTHLVSGLTIYPNVAYEGLGTHATCIKLKNSSNTHVLATLNFATLTGTNKTTIAEGVATGFAIRHLRIDGNKANNASGGHGLAIYGKAYKVEDVMVHDCKLDGLYSELGRGGLGTALDGASAEIGPIWSSNNGRHGIYYLGPHDGHFVGGVYTFLNGGDGLKIEDDGTTNNGACDLDFIHSYANTGIGVNAIGRFKAQYVQTEANFGAGLVLTSLYSNVEKLEAFRNQRDHEAGADAPWTDIHVDVQGASCQIGSATIRCEYGGTGLKIGNIDFGAGYVQVIGFATAGLGIDIDGSRANVRGFVKDFSGVGGLGVRYGQTAQRHESTLDLSMLNNATGFSSVTPGNRMWWSLMIDAGAGQVGHNITGAISTSNSFICVRAGGGGSSVGSYLLTGGLATS